MATTTAKALPDEALTEQALQRLLTAYEGRRQMFDPQMLAMAAGFLAPTQTGGFGESLSNAAKGVLQAGEVEQKQEQERAKGMLEIAQLKGQIAQRKRIQDQYADVLGQKFATPGAGESKPGTDEFTLGGLTKKEYLFDAAANGVSRAEAEEKWAKLKRENVTPKEGYVYNHQTGQYDPIDLSAEQVKLDLLARDADGGIQSVFVSKPEARDYQVAVAQARKSGKKEDWQKVFEFEKGFTQGIPSFDEKPAPPKEAAAKEEGAPLVVPLPQVGAAQEAPARPQFAPPAQVPPQAAPQIPPQAAPQVQPQAAPQVLPQAAPQGAASLATSPRVDAALGRPEAAPPPVAPAAPTRPPGALPFAIPTGGGAPAVAAGKPTGTPTAQQLAAQKAAAETQAAITKAGGEAQARANVEAAMGPPTAGNTSFAQTTGSNLARTETAGPAVKAEKTAEAEVAGQEGAVAAGRISQAQAEGKSAGEQTQLVLDKKRNAILTRQQGKDLERIVKETPTIFGLFDKPGVMNAALKFMGSPVTVGTTSVSVPLLYDAYLRGAGFSEKAIENYTTAKQYFSAIELAQARANKGQGGFTEMERLVLRNVAGQPSDSKDLVLKAAKFLQLSSDFDIKFANEYDKWIERFPRSNVIEFQRSGDYKEMEAKYDKQLENTFFPSAKPTSSAPRTQTGRSANVQRAFDLIGGSR
jgi:hypothetical protein